MTSAQATEQGWTAWGTPCWRAKGETEWHDVQDHVVPGHPRETIAQRVRRELAVRCFGKERTNRRVLA